jgi:hypothetical protein
VRNGVAISGTLWKGVPTTRMWATGYGFLAATFCKSLVSHLAKRERNTSYAQVIYDKLVTV